MKELTLHEAFDLVTRVTNEDYKPSDEEFKQLASFVDNQLLPMIKLITEAYEQVAKATYRLMSEAIESLPEEVQIALRAQVKNDRMTRARLNHPAGKSVNVSPLERQLRAQTNLIQDGPDYMARREAEIQSRMKIAGVTPTVIPLSSHPGYKRH